ncbi:hypothetical protein DFJ73DRAFT_345586 [Zopfochytrium polystomum]|nr:hypothetical protein DFJ73DRAFT_345586 [Zopfochytrium polystomum]
MCGVEREELWVKRVNKNDESLRCFCTHTQSHTVTPTRTYTRTYKRTTHTHTHTLSLSPSLSLTHTHSTPPHTNHTHLNRNNLQRQPALALAAAACVVVVDSRHHPRASLLPLRRRHRLHHRLHNDPRWPRDPGTPRARARAPFFLRREGREPVERERTRGGVGLGAK